jgi:hypothetical protein
MNKRLVLLNPVSVFKALMTLNIEIYLTKEIIDCSASDARAAVTADAVAYYNKSGKCKLNELGN